MENPFGLIRWKAVGLRGFAVEGERLDFAKKTIQSGNSFAYAFFYLVRA